MATINGSGLNVTYNGQAITDYVNQQALRDELDMVMSEVDTTIIPGTFSGSFSGSFTVTLHYTVQPYKAHCNKHLRNRLKLAPYKRVQWGIN
jgi:hypothetical protein